MTFLDRHPIAIGVVEQRIRERIHEWVIQNRPDVAVEMRRVMMEQLEEDYPAERWASTLSLLTERSEVRRERVKSLVFPTMKWGC